MQTLTLKELKETTVDMFSTVFIGNKQTKVIREKSGYTKGNIVYERQKGFYYMQGQQKEEKLASYLGRRGVRLHVCVATAYGESLLPEEKNITVTHDRMDSGQMGEFMRVFEPDYVIDATHPYAKEVTKT